MNQSPCKEESRMKVWTWKNRKSPKQEPEGPPLKESLKIGCSFHLMEEYHQHRFDRMYLT